MLPTWVAVIGNILAFSGGMYYFLSAWRGVTSPHRITYLLWGVFPLIIFAAQISQGVFIESIASLIAGGLALATVGASFRRSVRHWHVRRRSYWFGLAALSCIGVWYVTEEPNLALGLALGANILAAFPTFIKAYTHPASEYWPPYAISALGFGLVLLSSESWDFSHIAFVTYLTVANCALTFLAARKTVATRM